MNTDEDFKRAFDCGATGVMTDYPSKLKHWLEVHPEILQQTNSSKESSNVS